MILANCRRELRLVLSLALFAVFWLCIWSDGRVCEASSSMLTVIVDPGHGGQDSGCRGAGGVLEKEINLALARKLVQVIQEGGAVRAVLTRKDDYEVSLDDRAGFANHRKADLFISFHIGNSFRPVPLGFSVSYWAPTTAVPAASPFVQKISWDQAQRPYWEQSRSLAAQIQQELLRLLQWPTGGVVQTDLYLLRRVEMPAVLVELGSLSHPGEAAELQRPEFQQKVSYAVSEAIKQYTRMREDEAAPSGQTQQ